MKFYGSNQHGSVSKNNWINLSEGSLSKFASNKNLSKPKFKMGISELVFVISGLKTKETDEHKLKEIETLEQVLSRISSKTNLQAVSVVESAGVIKDATGSELLVAALL